MHSYWDFWDDYDVWHRNSFMIEFTEFDSLYVERRETNLIDTFSNQMKEFVLNPLNKENLPQKKEYVLPFFDTVNLSKQGFYINAVMVPDSNNNRTSWQNVNKAVNVILQNYVTLRKNLAINTWGKEFENLEFEKQMAVSLYFPINIWIYPNRHRVKPPPPPEPPRMTEEEILDSIMKQDNLKEIENIINENDNNW